MSQHSIFTRGQKWEWDDAVQDYSKQRSLLDLYTLIGNMHSWSMYEGEDPEKEWNNHVGELQSKVIDWLIELNAKDLVDEA